MEEPSRNTTRAREGREDGRLKHDPFNHPRDRRGYFRDNNKKLENLPEDQKIDLFSFVSKDKLPHVSNAYIQRVGGGSNKSTKVVMNINGQSMVHYYTGPLTGPDLLKYVSQFQMGNLDKEEVAITVDSRSKIDSMVIEKAYGFSTESGLPMAGNPRAEHWVLFYWDDDFYSEKLTNDQLDFFVNNKAAIAHKSAPGSDPDINYFKTRKDAVDRLTMLQSEHNRVA